MGSFIILDPTRFFFSCSFSEKQMQTERTDSITNRFIFSNLERFLLIRDLRKFTLRKLSQPPVKVVPTCSPFRTSKILPILHNRRNFTNRLPLLLILKKSTPSAPVSSFEKSEFELIQLATFPRISHSKLNFF